MGELERSIALDQFSHFLGCSRRQGWLPKLIGKRKSCLTIPIMVKKKIERMKCLTAHPWCLGSSVNDGTVTDAFKDAFQTASFCNHR
ncbi:hypothetical protein TNCV_2456711 [Trichonephila clavipes]|nr:hypothetical protein TNCV_2456711 [Trichonephila clavipes]